MGLAFRHKVTALSGGKMKLLSMYLLWLCQVPLRYDKPAFPFSLWLTNSGEDGTFLMRAHAKVKTILNKDRHGLAIKMQQSSCAGSPFRG
jgi:hypothetical protein